jgi:hypothetical protein
VQPRAGWTGGDSVVSRPSVKLVKSALPFAVVMAVAALCSSAGATVAGGTGACVMPRLLALTPEVAEARLTSAGCLPGTVSYERPLARVALVTGQVPLPGAVLPHGARVALLIS